jgi:hypothetical protein
VPGNLTVSFPDGTARPTNRSAIAGASYRDATSINLVHMIGVFMKRERPPGHNDPGQPHMSGDEVLSQFADMLKDYPCRTSQRFPKD